MPRALVVAVIASTLGQPPGGQAFVGRWAADYNGRPLVRLEVSTNAGGLSGRIQLADMHVDEKGDVDTVLGDLSEPKPLLDIVLRNGTLAFSSRDDNDVDQFELRTIDERTAELRFDVSEPLRRELAQDGIPMPRPIRLTRLPQ